MRKFALLLVAFLLGSLAAAAQEKPAAFAEPDPAAAAPAPQGGQSPAYYPWQVAMMYQYDRMRLPGGPWNPAGSYYSTNGYSMAVTRFFGRSYFGAEGQLSSGFGNTGSTTFPKNLAARTLFLGGGIRVSTRNFWRVEPWVHALVGLERYRFTETANGLGPSNSFAYEFGGGMDFHASDQVAIRIGVDELGTRLFSGNQANLQIVGGLVFNF